MDAKSWKSEFTFWINYKPIVTTKDNCRTIKFKKDGKLHNICFPSEVVIVDGNIVSVCYSENGILHRPPEDGVDKPAIIEYHDNGKICYMSFYIEGKKHRNIINGVSQPAYIEFYENGTLRIEKYYINGVTYREPVYLPTDVRYYENGTPESERYHVQGTLHRNPINGVYQPAYISYYKNGTIKVEVYYIHGRKHRSPIDGIDQPAKIHYDKNGQQEVIEYWIYDQLHRNPINEVSQPACIIKKAELLSEVYLTRNMYHRFPVNDRYLPTRINYEPGNNFKTEYYHLKDRMIVETVKVKNPELWNQSKGIRFEKLEKIVSRLSTGVELM